jgi:hypothetical protein
MPQISEDGVAYLIHHMVLPPKLPQADDSSATHDRTLLDTTVKGLQNLRRDVQDIQPDEAHQIRSVVVSLQNLGRSRNNDGYIVESQLADILHKIAIGVSIGAVPLEIKAQNAGVVVSKHREDIVFEVFELSPSNEAVMTTKGRLVRSFPSHACQIPVARFLEEGFISALAHTLSKLSFQGIPEFQPTSRKAGDEHSETRDTTHPGMVTEYLMNVLLATGQSADISSIWKNTREDVSWSDALHPWRRSPLWLLIRVTMQQQFTRFASRSLITENLYKPAMASIMAFVLNAALEHHGTIGIEFIYAVSAKLTRRLRKVKFAQPDMSRELHTSYARAALANAVDLMHEKWKIIQEQTPSSIEETIIPILQPHNDISILLPELDKFIEGISSRKKILNSVAFQPPSNFHSFSPLEIPADIAGEGEYEYFQLAATELWVEEHLSSWLDHHMEDDSTCHRLRTLMQSYYHAATKTYSNTAIPRSLSVMYLTVAEIWVASDKCACHLHPLLLEYDPDINVNLLQCLSLPFKDQLDRLAKVEDHVRGRQSIAKQKAPNAPSLFSNFGHPSSFAVKFFDTSAAHQTLRFYIEHQAAVKREQKCQELAEKQQEYRELLARSDRLSCEEQEVLFDRVNNLTMTKHSPSCSRCALRAEAEKIGIEVYEWPLSPTSHIAKATVFELHIPHSFSNWRDMTVFLMMDVLGFNYVRDSRPTKSYPLGSYRSLSDFGTIPPGQRIGILSSVKPLAGSHYKSKAFISFLDGKDICVDNVLQYQYFDVDKGVFSNAFQPTDKVLTECTYRLTNRSSQLQPYLGMVATLGHVTPNSVIASLSNCPDYFTLLEYKAFGVLAIGQHVSYMNILIQLAMPNIDFTKSETQTLVRQIIHQAGPPSPEGNVERTTHQVLVDESLCQTLMDKPDTSMIRVTENWESWRALETFVQITLRIVSLSPSAAVTSRGLRGLKVARQISMKWLNTLKERIHTCTEMAQRVELCSAATEIALVCTSTFDVTSALLQDLLDQPSAVSVLFQSSIFVQENMHNTSSEHEYLFRTTLQSWRLLLFRAFLPLRDGIFSAMFQEGLNQAINACWASFRPTAHWHSFDGLSDQWVYVQCSELTVHFNLLTAELLVNGLPLSRLPQQYLARELYSRLFLRSVIEVMPSNEPGMAFSSKHPYRGYEVDIGIIGCELLVVATRGSRKLHLVPSRLLHGQLPSAFVEECVHWYDPDSKEIEFRPRGEAWSSSAGFWRLKKMWKTKTPDTPWQLVNGQACLVNPKSPIGRALTELFSSLEHPPFIHIMMDILSSNISIELPHQRLGFHVTSGESLIQSRQYPGMMIDPDQKIGTLTGLVNKLVLKHINGVGDRLVLIPEGLATFENVSNHVIVTIQPNSKRNVHAYQLDTTIGRIMDNGSLQSKLFLSYLHAVTSYCLPDPLTGHTGTEAALLILRSGAVSSFDVFEEHDLSLLRLIARLTPG